MKLATSEEAAEMDGESCGIDGACGRAATPRESLPHTLPRWPASPDPGPGQVPRKACRRNGTACTLAAAPSCE
eukprot:scaffold5981_cov141-Isochrysis_galbana.AAC.4